MAKNSEAFVRIVVAGHSPETRLFAATELAKYLHEISRASFGIDSSGKRNGPAIAIERNLSFEPEQYCIAVHGNNIVLSAGSGRAELYAVYDFLQRLGCVWIAPQLEFYGGTSEYVPHRSILYYSAMGPVYETPRFKYRKIDVEEGRSHDLKNLEQLIDWMPKVRFNILMVPLNYGGGGRVKWDNWRKQLAPELKKRGLMIEVGGHGYQNFLNATMEDSTLFDKHPDWFGKDKNCNPDPRQSIVFNTSNENAVIYLIQNVVKYLTSHPEIDIFDFWPPDGAHWGDCPEFKKLGLPVDRQALLVNKVDTAIRNALPGVRLEMIAYQPALSPPKNVKLNKNILVDFCPINQSFEKQIYDSTAANNAGYIKALHAWRHFFTGDIGLYSYFRKYAWHSLPNVIPHYMQRDMKWYASVPLQGISTYAEPGDWYTYELNHFILGCLAWNPDINVDSIINRYGVVRYGRVWQKIHPSYLFLERFVPVYGSIPYTRLKTKNEIKEAESKLVSQITVVTKEKEKVSDAIVKSNLSRLLLMLRYAVYDLNIQEQIATQKKEIKAMQHLLLFLENNKDKGVFILSNNNGLAWLKRHYHVSQSKND